MVAECPGNPDALGTSRVLTLKPGQLTRLGIMQYPQTLPLADRKRTAPCAGAQLNTRDRRSWVLSAEA
jgi:hypothetical protein